MSEAVAAPVDGEDVEKQEDNDNVSGDGGDDGDDGDVKQEYVKKEFIAKPWVSDSGALEEV